jgi:hypothetical protein
MLVELTIYEVLWDKGPRVDGQNIQVVIINTNLIDSMYKAMVLGKECIYIALNKRIMIDTTSNTVNWFIAPHWPEGLLK